jgi:adenylylsulfate kinase
MVILIMGLPGGGKSTLTKVIQFELILAGHTAYHLNADELRAEANDWDFSIEGRKRQGQRMAKRSKHFSIDHEFVLCDIIAPMQEMRMDINPDYTIWVNTIESGRFEDTNKLFVPPSKPDFIVTEKNADRWGKILADCIRGINNV